MSHDYAMSRVRDAIEKSGGNHLKAQRLILQWAEKDQSLLFGLVTPHLQSIVSHAVNHADQPAKKPMPKRVQVDEALGEFGAAMASSLKGGRMEGVGFGEPDSKNINKPGAASKAHIDAITKIASASKSAAKGSDDKKKK